MIVIGIVGVLAALAVYGVRNYLTTARTAEAKAGVGAISQLGSAVFEREYAKAELINASAGGVSAPAINFLCGSANAVPATIPKGAKYQPSNSAGTDFHNGSPNGGWICLGYTMSTPIYYQYQYIKAGPYMSPAMGGPDPGPLGFEAIAQGDLDGDNAPSTFARTATIVGKSLRVSTHIFVGDEFE